MGRTFPDYNADTLRSNSLSSFGAHSPANRGSAVSFRPRTIRMRKTRGAFHQELLGKRYRSEHFDNFLRRVSVSIRVRHPLQGSTEFRTHGDSYFLENRINIGASI